MASSAASSSSLSKLLLTRNTNITTRKALIVLDLQNDFVQEDGKLPVTLLDGFRTHLVDLTAAFRNASSEVVWVTSEFDSPQPVNDATLILHADPASPVEKASDDGEDSEEEMLREALAGKRASWGDRPSAFRMAAAIRRSSRKTSNPQHASSRDAFLSRAEGLNTCCLPDTEGSRLCDLALPALDVSKDLQSTKTRYSAFDSDNLRLLNLLRSRLVTELYLCGSLTNVAVYATASDAVGHGFDVYVVDDCLGFRNFSAHEEALVRMVDVMGVERLSARDCIAQLRGTETNVTSTTESGGLQLDAKDPEITSESKLGQSNDDSKSYTSPKPANEIVGQTADHSDGQNKEDPESDSFITVLADSSLGRNADAHQGTATEFVLQHEDSSQESSEITNTFANLRLRDTSHERRQNLAEDHVSASSNEVLQTYAPYLNHVNAILNSEKEKKENSHLNHENKHHRNAEVDEKTNSTASASADGQEVSHHYDMLSNVKNSTRNDQTQQASSEETSEDIQTFVATVPNTRMPEEMTGIGATAIGIPTLSPVEDSQGIGIGIIDDPALAPVDSARETRSGRRRSRGVVHQILGPGDRIGEGDSLVIHNAIPELLDNSKWHFLKLKHEVYWQTMSHAHGNVPRLVCVQGLIDPVDGSMPVYRHPADQSLPLLHFSPTVFRIRMAVQAIVGHPVNHVLIQLYRDGQDNISEHSDKTLDIVRGSSIVNVSLGAQRTMRLRTKKSASAPAGVTEGNRQTQLVPLPNLSVFVLGPQTNMMWLHGIQPDKRPAVERSDEELDFSGERISLTFRHVGTFLDADSKKIWGQGACRKTKQEAQPVVNEDPEANQLLIDAFGSENQQTVFDWDAVYGKGFDVLHFVQSPWENMPLLLRSGHLADDERIQFYLEEIGLPYHIAGSSSPGTERTIKTRVCFRDVDVLKSQIYGVGPILMYLYQVYSRTQLPRAVAAEVSNLMVSDVSGSNVSGDNDAFNRTSRVLERLNAGVEGFAAGSCFSIADCFYLLLIEEEVERFEVWWKQHSDEEMAGHKLVVAYCERMKRRESIRKVMKGRTAGSSGREGGLKSTGNGSSKLEFSTVIVSAIECEGNDLPGRPVDHTPPPSLTSTTRFLRPRRRILASLRAGPGEKKEERRKGDREGKRRAKVETMDYKHPYFSVTHPFPGVAHVEIDRAEKMNAFVEVMWLNMADIFRKLDRDEEVRCVVLSGKGERAFTTGLDVQAASQSGITSPAMAREDAARTAVGIRDHILEFQDCISAVERCKKPVIAVLHGYSFGLAIDISTAADIRICAADTKFCVKEIDIGLAADIGTLTRLPTSGVPLSWAKDVCLTARVFSAPEALRVGFVSEVYGSKHEAVEKALEKAVLIAGKSPVAVVGTKHLVDWSVGRGRGGRVEEGLGYTAVWNMAMLQTADVQKAITSGLTKKVPTFSKL